ncbi:MAG: Spy/CpxP family protein refolding chaperone [Pseudomonadales bacterium]|nr:Spy/CpxP family protein refolding chaperone [Pseudomonadales bacterium]
MIGSMHRWRAMRASILAVTIGGLGAGCQHGDGHEGGHGFGARRHADPEHCTRRARARIEDLAAWVDGRLELDEVQRAHLEELELTASASAGELGALCDHPERGDIEGMLAFGEEALASSLANYRRVRPALERFVASLDAQQRAEVEDWLSHRHGLRSWRRG